MPKNLQTSPWARAKARYFSQGRAEAPAGSGAARSAFGPATRTWSWSAIYPGLAGFLLGRLTVAGIFAPFGLAFFLAVRLSAPAGAMAAAAGVVMGAFTSGSWYRGIEAAVVIALLARMLPRLRFASAKTWAGAALSLFLVSFAVQAGRSAILTPTADRFLQAFLDALQQMALVPVLLRVLPLRKGRTLGENPPAAALPLLLLAVSFLHLQQFRLGGYSIANIGSCLALLVLAQAGGPGVGAGLGVVFSVATDLAAGLNPSRIGLFAFIGLLAGALRGFGKLGTGLGLVLGNLLFSFFLPLDATLPVSFGETLVAWGLLALVPRRQIESLRRLLPGAGEAPPAADPADKRRQDLLSSRLAEFARVFHELSGAFTQVAAGKEFTGGRDLSVGLRVVVDRVCTGCDHYALCWEKDFFGSSQYILEMLRTADAVGTVSPAAGPAHRCPRRPEVAGTINNLAELYRLDRYWRRKVDETREVVAGQLAGVAQIVTGLASEVRLDFASREEFAAALADALDEEGIGCREIEVKNLERNRVEIRLCRAACPGNSLCETRLAPLASRLAGQALSVQKVRCRRSGCSFKLVTAQMFRLETGFSQAVKDGSHISGDTQMLRHYREGKFVLLLSDGMGSGARAAMESSATVTLLEQLLAAGFGRDLAVRTVNSILVLRSPEETFATVDMASIDLQSGLAELVKIGAAPGYLKRGKEVAVIKSASLPIGILNNIEIDVVQKNLRPDDILVLVSDGVTDAAASLSRDEWLEEFLRRTAIGEPQALAEAILQQAKSLAQGQLKDDMTVLVGKLSLAG